MDSAYKTALDFDEQKKMPFGSGYYADVGKTDQLAFGELHVPPHSKAGMDAGHPGADEVFYIAEGTARIAFPESGEQEIAKQGQYIMMPRGQAHEVSNIGESNLKLLYFCIANK